MRFHPPSSDLAKTLAFGVIHIGLAITIGWLLTGSFAFGTALALIEPVCNTWVTHHVAKLFNSGGRGRPTVLASATIGVAHLAVAVTLATLLTGSLASAWAYALIEPAANAVAHYFFERWWHRASVRAVAVPL